MLSNEQLRFIADKLLIEPSMMVFQQEHIHLLEVESPDPVIIASLIYEEYLPIKKMYPRNFKTKTLQKAKREEVEQWLVWVYEWCRYHQQEINDYQFTRRWRANKRNPDLNPKWGKFLALAKEMFIGYDYCMKCKKQGGNLHYDHIKSCEQGGGVFHLANLQRLCQACNISKSATTVDYRPAAFKEHVKAFCEKHSPFITDMLMTPEPSKEWLGSQPIQMKRIMHPSVKSVA